MTDVYLGKLSSVERSIQRARQELAAAGAGLPGDLTRQDAAVLNVLRACETSIDLANALVNDRKLGIPQSNRDSFRLLGEAGLISESLSAQLQKMVGFRNVAVHRYRDIDLDVLVSIIRQDLDDLLRFTEIVARLD
jgi:uncharacterized protein YutE (UPF0331/DUF86 family)